MPKTVKITVAIEPEFLDAVNKKVEETGIPYSKIVRRALQLWVENGELPKKGERKTKQKQSR